MPQAVAYAGSYLMMSGAAEGLGAFMLSNAAIISTTLTVVGGLAYSQQKEQQAQQAAKDQYNASRVDRLVSIDSTVAPRELVLGRVRKGGAIFYKASTALAQRSLYLCIALAGHEIDAVEHIYFNDELITLDEDGNVTTAPYGAANVVQSGSVGTGDGYTATLPAGYIAGSATGTYQGEIGEDRSGSPRIGAIACDITVDGNVATSTHTGTTIQYQYTGSSSYAHVQVHLGGSDQVVDPDLLAVFPDDWKIDNKVTGVAYLMVNLFYDENVFTAGIPRITAVVRGAKLFDPRNDTTAWSENPALMMRHVYAHPKFGKADVTATEDARFIAAANACDTSTAYHLAATTAADGSAIAATTETKPLFRGSLVLSYGTPAKSGFDDLAQAMGGSWAFAGGELYLKAGVYTAPIMTLTDADLAVVSRSGASESQDPIKISVHKARANQFNTVKVKIWNHAQDFKEVSLPALTGSELLERDGVELSQEVSYPAIGYAPQALHVAGIMMRDARDPLAVELPFKLTAYPIELFDTVALSLERYGWVNKTFMVVGRVWSSEGKLILTLKEINVFITTLDAEFHAGGYGPNTNLPTPWVVADVGPLTVTVGSAVDLINADGTVVKRMLVEWPQIEDAAVIANGNIEVQYRASTSSGEWTVLMLPGADTRVYATDIVDGVIYIVRARGRTTAGVGRWSAQVSSDGSSATNAPAGISSATATSGMFCVILKWVFAGSDANILGTEIWWSATNNRNIAARLSVEPYPATEYTHVGLSPGQGGYYWLRVLNNSGVKSGWYPASATAGLHASASADPSDLLDMLAEAIDVNGLTANLREQIELIDGIELLRLKGVVDNSSVAVGISVEQTTRQTADEAEATLRTILAAEVSDTQAAILDEMTVRATADTALATATTQVQARLDTGDFAAVKVQASAFADRAGTLEARYTVKLNVNGYASGFETVNNGEISSCTFLVDKFLIARNDGAGGAVPMFMMGQVNGMTMAGINGNLVVDGTIVSRSLVANSIKAEHLMIGGNAATACVSGQSSGGTASVSMQLNYAADVQLLGQAALPNAANIGLYYRQHDTSTWIQAGQGDEYVQGTGVVAAKLSLSVGVWDFALIAAGGLRATVIALASIR